MFLVIIVACLGLLDCALLGLTLLAVCRGLVA